MGGEAEVAVAVVGALGVSYGDDIADCSAQDSAPMPVIKDGEVKGEVVGDLGADDGDATVDCLVRDEVDLNNENIVKGSELECEHSGEADNASLSVTMADEGEVAVVGAREGGDRNAAVDCLASYEVELNNENNIKESDLECEHSGEPDRGLLPVIMGGESEVVVVGALGVEEGDATDNCLARDEVDLNNENIVKESDLECEHSGETDSTSLPMIMAGDGKVAVVDALEVAVANATVDCSTQAEVDLNNENIVNESGFASDHMEGTLCNTVGERLEELVVEPLSRLDISSQASQNGKGPSDNDCYLDSDVHTLKDTDGNFNDRCQSTVEGSMGDSMGAERNSEQIGGRLDLTTVCANDVIGRGNVSDIECGLNRVCFDEIECEAEIAIGQCKSETNLRHTKVTGDYQEPSEKQEITCLIMPVKSISDIAVVALNVDRISDTLNSDKDDGNSSERKDDDGSELKCLYSPVSLRRSSRSRKTVQKVQRGKKAIKVSKKSSTLTLCGMVDLFSDATRKKRSCLSRSICSSGWGLQGRFSKYFECSNEADAKQVLDEEKPEMKPRKRSSKKNPSKVVESSHLAEERRALPYRPIRLKVTFGKKAEHNDVVSVINTESTSENVVDDPVQKETCMLVKCNSSTSKFPLNETNFDTGSVSGKSTNSHSLRLVDPEKHDSSDAVKFLDPGTSPDSEVIDSSVGPNPLLNTFDKNLALADSFSVPLSLICPTASHSTKNKRNKKNKQLRADSPQKAEKSKDGLCQKHNSNFSVDGTNVPGENPLSNTSGSGSELVSMELLSVNNEDSQKASSLDNGVDCNLSLRMVGIESADTGNSIHLVSPPETQQKNSKGSKMKGKSKKQPKITTAKSNQKEPSCQRKGNKKSASKRQGKATTITDEAPKDMDQPGEGNLELVVVDNIDSSSGLESQNLSCLALPPNGVVEQTLSPRVAWVCCDECEKWRCIPANLADAIEETNGKWTCKDNQDQAFADCSIPQEKSNAAINAELEISDEEDGRGRDLSYKDSGTSPPGDPQQSTWMRIKANIFLHRRRKTQTMDEVMVCHCKPPVDGSRGCGTQCLNRMLNIECVHGTCPCGDLCSNQQFQQRLYANLNWFRSGRKGYGLQVLEDISEGKFLIEYVGEVLDLQSYEARQKDYALKGHKHFYFMTLNGNEVIDACSKGNLGRFVNHSCDPNCRTEKWVVNGEICVGLFALRNIRKGEELTFDYNYVRVFGAAAKKCYCAALKCRGYIGGDPLSSEVVIHEDSDEEFPEPVAVDENGQLAHSLEKDMVDRSSSQDVEHMLKEDALNEQTSAMVITDVNMIKALEECSNEVIRQSMNLKDMAVLSEVCESSNRLAAIEAEKDKNVPIAVDEVCECSNGSEALEVDKEKIEPIPVDDVLAIESTASKSPLHSVDSGDKMSIVISEVDRPLSNARPRTKISRPSKSTKNRKFSSISACDENAVLTVQPLKSQVLSYKSKKLLEGSVNAHLEGVEGKLNELLDADGGICKKKDASKGYLKLLLLTAASGDCGNGGAIQSNRELSMILDAFLKTKSRGVLLDIISKNGLQMLHNMMKLYRKDFKKTPILRKLLKVLEFLAEKEILSVERIIGDSLRPGVESFRESILNLTEHEDKKVHQIARNFRDRWIPRPLRNKYNVGENIDRKREFSRSSNCNRFLEICNSRREQGTKMPEPIESMKPSPSLNNFFNPRTSEGPSPQLTNFQTVTSQPRKRKSRWDQPADPTFLKRCKNQVIEPFSPNKIKALPKSEAKGGKEAVWEDKDCSMTDDGMENSEDDAPPGFSCLQNDGGAPPGFSSPIPAENLHSFECPSVVSMGLLQERFNPCKPVSFGIPYSVLKQFGSCQSVTSDIWDVAPSFPFKPFPPLPPYPRDKKSHRDPCPVEPAPGMPSTSGSSLPPVPNNGHTNQNISHRGRGPRNIMGRRYHKHKGLKPPWVRNLDGRGFKGNHSRNRVFGRSMGTKARDEHNGQHFRGDVNQSLDCADNSC